MDINKTVDGTTVTLAVSGRLDTTTSPELEAAVDECISACKLLVFDFANLDFISSAGLRVLLKAQKIMNKQGSMLVKNSNDVVLEVFEVTGFIDILTVE